MDIEQFNGTLSEKEGQGQKDLLEGYRLTSEESRKDCSSYYESLVYLPDNIFLAGFLIT